MPRLTISIDGLKPLDPAFLAPMSGVTDLPFRRIAHDFGAGLVVSEMVASEALTHGNPDMALKVEGIGIRPHVVQLAGREAYWMAEGARIAEANGAALIDINMGCPAKRVTSGYSGAALMRDLDEALRLIEATIRAVQVPVSLKMRLGWDEATINAPDLARRAEHAGIRMITVHARTRCQFYKGQANWDAVRAVKSAVGVPVIINGDITDPDAAETALEVSGADGVMIGRGAYGRPWLPGQIAAELTGSPVPSTPKGGDLLDLILDHHDQILGHYGAEIGLRAARKHLDWYMAAAVAAGHQANGDLRRRILTATDVKVVHHGLHRWFDGDGLEAAA